MTARPVLDRVTVMAATLACFGFLIGLYDVALHGPSPAPLSLAPPVATADRKAELVVQVVSGGKDGHRLDGPPVPEATVRVFWTLGDRYYLAAAGRTDAHGRVDLRRLPRGKSWVVAEAPGRARGSVQLVLGSVARQVRVALADAHLLQVTVLDESQRPIPRATVLVNTGDPLPFGALTGADGVARLDFLGPPPWSVKASAPSFESVTRSSVQTDVTMILRDLAALVVRVEGPDGAPVEAATVDIAGVNLFPARRAETDARGLANIVGLLAGTYDLRAYHGQLVSETLMGVALQRGRPENVTLRLTPGRMVTVVVTDGEADDASVVPAADVVLVEGGLSSFPLHARTRTDGTALVGPIAPGPATVAARSSGFVASAAIPVPDPLEGPLRIALLRGAVLEGEVVDTRGFAVPGASVEVIGSDRYGLPIAETPMLLGFRRTHFEWALPGPAPLLPLGELGVMPGPVPPIPPPGGLFGDAISPWTPPAIGAELPAEPIEPWVTRADGTFRAHPVTPGRVAAVVRHPAYVTGLSETVRLGPGEVGTVRVVLRAGGTLEGRVLDDRGFPVAAARVDVVDVRGTYHCTTLTASDGSFAFAAVPEQVWLGVARPEDLSHIVMRERAEVADDDRTSIELVLPPVRESARIIVLDDDAQALSGAQVTILSVDPSAPLRQTLFTDNDGVVSIEDVRGLPLRVSAECPGWSREAQEIAAMPETLELVLHRGAVVTGTVTAIRGRRFVSGATVTIVSAGMRRVARTDEQGAFQLSDVDPGPTRVIVSHPAYATRELDIDVQSPGPLSRAQELDPIDLDDPGEIEGEVVDANGEPVSGARLGIGVVPAYAPAGASLDTMTVTDTRGRFRLTGVNPGTIELQAYAPEVGRGSTTVGVEPGRPTADVRIQLTAEASEADATAACSVAVTLGERGTDPVEVVIVDVSELSEAERAGLRPGDVLVAVDGVEPVDMHDARARLSGPESSDVVIEVRRDDGTHRFTTARERVRQ